MSLRVMEVSARDRDWIGEAIGALERGITYPLGEDRFAIDHGSDYFAFFDRLGETTTFVALDGDAVVGCATGVLRDIDRAGRRSQAWYCCDLKVTRSHRGRRIPCASCFTGCGGTIAAAAAGTVWRCDRPMVAGLPPFDWSSTFGSSARAWDQGCTSSNSTRRRCSVGRQSSRSTADR